MKTLLLLRHAKSSHKDKTLSDIERPLNERGIGDAKLIGGVLRRKKLKPDLIICSPSERTRQTVALMLRSARPKVEVKFDDRVYEASASVLFTVLKQITESNTVMLIGHNPGLEDLLEALTGASVRLPTAALACIKLNVDQWNKVRAETGHLVYRVRPKELKAPVEAKSKTE